MNFSVYRVFAPVTRGLFVAILSALLLAPYVQAASKTPQQSQRGMVVTSQVDAANAGREMLAKGGNAVDAAVATAFALSVTQPFSSGLGGGAFVLIRTADGETIAIDARETAPAKAHRDMYIEEGVPKFASRSGALAVATPGLVQGLALALDRWGTLPLATVIAPAIKLAKDGFEIGPYHARMVSRMRKYLDAERFPETVRIQFNGGGAVEVGWRLVQKDLAKTMKAIAKKGPKAMYSGSVGKAIASEVAKRGGILTLEDLKAYKPVLREAVSGNYRGLEIHSYPPPSSGGVVLLEVLNILEGYDLAQHGAGSSASVHLIGEAMKLAFADRAAYMGDADFVDVPVAKLISKQYAKKQRARINAPNADRALGTGFDKEMAITVEGPGLPNNDSGTAHLSVVDGADNAVSITAGRYARLERDRTTKTTAFEHDAHDRRQRRQAHDGERQPRRTAHYHDDIAHDLKRGRLRDERPRSRGGAALPPPVGSRQVVLGTRVFQRRGSRPRRERAHRRHLG